MAGQTERLESIWLRTRKSIPKGSTEPLLVAVTKGRPPEEILELYNLGIRDFGENRVLEALPKINSLPKGIRWHFIGHLQSNKVNEAVGKFALIHSVDSPKLLEKISNRARELGVVQNVLLEVNISGEGTKFGLAPSEVKHLLEKARTLPNVRVSGLMAMAPYRAKEEEARRIFGSLRELAHSLGLAELSMGMSDDFELAVKEGATIMRIGRALFENSESQHSKK
jgi:PLP dependent protein